jgi:hypothetical protein
MAIFAGRLFELMSKMVGRPAETRAGKWVRAVEWDAPRAYLSPERDEKGCDDNSRGNVASCGMQSINIEACGPELRANTLDQFHWGWFDIL